LFGWGRESVTAPARQFEEADIGGEAPTKPEVTAQLFFATPDS